MFLILQSLATEYDFRKKKELRKQMNLEQMLPAVKNETIQFATMRPPGSRYAVLERQVIITAPPELVTLSKTSQVQVLEALVELLKEPEKAWAAEVLLAAMTRREEKIVDSFSTSPEEWLESLGKTAHQRWSTWLEEKRSKLIWDTESEVFIEQE